MATISVTSDLAVSEKYETLIRQSLSNDSAYIRAKETIEDLVTNGSIDETQKAQVLSQVVGGMINNITSSSMSTAMQWAQAEKEIALKKLELEIQLDVLAQESLLKQAQIDKIYNDIRVANTESGALYGTATYDVNGNVIAITDNGKVGKEKELMDAQISKSQVEENLVTQKIQESQAAVHKLVADAVANYGSYSFTLDNGGISGVSGNTTNSLSETQRKIAIEQAKGYSYNAWANALTGSASMLGTAIAADLAEFGPGSTGDTLLSTVLSAANKLNSASTPT